MQRRNKTFYFQIQQRIPQKKNWNILAIRNKDKKKFMSESRKIETL